MKQAFFLILFFLFQTANGQFAVVQVRNGYVNVRKTPEIGNNIIDTLYDGQIIYYYIKPKGDWFEIEYETYKSGYIHKSVFKPIRRFDSIQTKIKTKDTLIFQNDSIKIVLTKTPFITKNNQLQYSKEDKKHNIGSSLEKINGKRSWGTAGVIPRTQYGQISIEWGKNKFDLPKDTFDDLFEPTFEYKYTSVYFDKVRNRIYIYASNSDGAGGYDVLWIIENGKYITRYLSNFYA